MRKHWVWTSFIAVMLMLVTWAGLNRVGASGTQEYTWKSVVTGGGGGYVPGLVFNTGYKDVLFARTDMGGAYRWEPTTGTWTQLLGWIGFDDWNWTGCESIVTDPTDPDRLYLAVGTYTNSWAPTNGAILRSSDRGNTFERFNLPFKLGSNMPGRGMGERLALDPNKTSILYLGARSGNGLWRSTDSGATWSKVTSFPNAGTYVQDPAQEYLADKPGVLWITFDPKTGTKGSATQTIYVGVADKDKSIYCSTDGGATWGAVAGQPTGYLPHHGVLSSNGILYVTYSNTQGPYDGSKGEVYKLNTASGVWTQISPVPASSSDLYYGYGGLAVDAQHPDTLMVTSMNSWWPDSFIFRSTDAGATWTRIWDWTSYPSRSLRYTLDISNAPWLNFGNTNPVEPEPAVKLGWMTDNIVIDPFNSDRMFYTTGATVYGTNNLTDWDNGGKINIKSLALGIEEAAVQDLVSPPSGASLYSALGDISGFRHDDLAKSPDQMYAIPFVGTYTSIDYAELKPEFLVRVGNRVDTSSSTVLSGSAFTYDGGKNWFKGNSAISGATNGGTVAAAADASLVVWAPLGGKVSYSKDNGNTWIASSGVPVNAQVRSDRVNPKKFYAFAAGKFYVSNDGGATFSDTGATTLPTAGTGQFKVIPGKEGDIWLCGEDGLYHSTDSGATFTKLSNVTRADTIGFGKAAPGKSYMALYTCAIIDGVRGIFRSDDAGANWIRVNDDQHQYGCTNVCITGDPRVYGRVYLGSNGFGIIYGDIKGTVISPSPTQSTVVTPTPSKTPVVTPTPSQTPVVTPTPSETPVVTPSPSETPTPSKSPVSGAFAVTYSVVNDWGGGATVNVTVKNTGSATVEGWQIAWTFAGNQKLANLWNGSFTQSGSTVTVTDASYNGKITPGGSVSFGFNLNYSGTNAKPSVFTVNGVAAQ